LIYTIKHSSVSGVRVCSLCSCIAEPIVNLTAFIGYRYQSPGKGFLFRVGLTPSLSLDNKANYPDKVMLIDGGLSIGYHF
jgi:hypothetical protein